MCIINYGKECEIISTTCNTEIKEEKVPLIIQSLANRLFKYSNGLHYDLLDWFDTIHVSGCPCQITMKRTFPMLPFCILINCNCNITSLWEVVKACKKDVLFEDTLK